MKRILFILLFLSNFCLAQQNGNVPPQTDILFDVGSSQLSRSAKHIIDSILYADMLPPNRKVSIIGFADILGNKEGNQLLSQERCNAVIQYLIKMGLDSAQLEQITAEGQIERPKKTGGYPDDRKVIIVAGDFLLPGKVEYNDSGKLVATVLFGYTNLNLFRGSLSILDTIVKVLNAAPKTHITLDGYVCCFNYNNLSREDYIRREPKRFTDTAVLNGAQRLSFARDKLIFAYLKAQGIDTTRLTCRTYGYLKNKLLPDGRSAHGMDRVEIRSH